MGNTRFWGGTPPMYKPPGLPGYESFKNPSGYTPPSNSIPGTVRPTNTPVKYNTPKVDRYTPSRPATLPQLDRKKGYNYQPPKPAGNYVPGKQAKPSSGIKQPNPNKTRLPIKNTPGFDKNKIPQQPPRYPGETKPGRTPTQPSAPTKPKGFNLLKYLPLGGLPFLGGDTPKAKPIRDNPAGGGKTMPPGYNFPPITPPPGGYCYVYVTVGGVTNFAYVNGKLQEPGILVKAKVVILVVGTVSGARINDRTPFVKSLPEFTFSLLGVNGTSTGSVIKRDLYSPMMDYAQVVPNRILGISYTPVEGEYNPSSPVPETPEFTVPESDIVPQVDTRPEVVPIPGTETPEPQKDRVPGITEDGQPANNPTPGETTTPAPNTPAQPGTPNAPSTEGGTGGGTTNTPTNTPTQEDLEVPESVRNKLTELEDKVTELTNRVEDPEKKGLTCKFERTNLDEINSKLDQILELLNKKNADDPDQYDSIQLPLAVKTGERSGEIVTRTLVVKKGQGNIASQFATSAGWAMLGFQAPLLTTIAKILNWESIFDDDGRASVNAKQIVEEAGQAQTQDDGATFNPAPAIGLGGLIALFSGAAWIRQGLHTLPRQVTTSTLNAADNTLTPTTGMANNAVDVTMTTTSQGNAIMTGLKGVNRFIKRASEQLKLDRVLNVLTLITTIHNAWMLSNTLKDTLISIVDNVLATTGLMPKDEDGDEMQFSELINKTAEQFIKGLVGEDVYNNVSSTWKKANRILNAAMSIIYAVQNMISSVLNALEVIGSWVAWIGNALKKWGVVWEKAYAWMNPSPNFQNRFFTALEKGQEIADNVEEITSSVRDAGEQFNDLGDLKKELDDSLKEGTARVQVDNDEQKNKQTSEKEVSNSPIINPLDLFRPESND